MWNVIQCASQGTSHIKAGTPCQDRTYSFVNKDGCAIALADGAGSAPLSHYGAEAVTRLVCENIYEGFDEFYSTDDGVEIKKKLLGRIQSRLSEVATDKKCDIKDLASTLLVVSVKNDRYIIAHIGDGVVGVLKDNQIKVASHPENGEFTNTTVFTTSPEAIMSMKLFRGRTDSIDGFVLMSDGAEASLYDKRSRTIVESIKLVMYRMAAESSQSVQEQLQHSCDTLFRKKTSDDCSVIIMSKDNLTPHYFELTTAEKCRLLRFGKVSEKKIRRCDAIIEFCKQGKTIAQIARHIYVAEKYIDKYLLPLYRAGLIIRSSGRYRSIVSRKLN